MILAEATAKVAELAKEEADAAEEKAQAAADARGCIGCRHLTQAELKKKEEATAAAQEAAEKREKFEVDLTPSLTLSSPSSLSRRTRRRWRVP